MNSGYKSLKKNIEYRNVYREGRMKNSLFFTLYYKKNNLPYSVIGLSISKKVGNSVVRNKLKRRMREILRENYSILSDGYDFIFIIRKPAADLDFQNLKEAFFKVLKSAGMVKCDVV